MATEQEELHLVVSLDDQASAQLASLRQQLASMSAGMSQAGTNIGGKSTEATKAVKGLHTELSAVAGRAGFIGGAVGGITSELTKLGISIAQRATDFEGLSRSMVQMGVAANEMGTSTAQLRQNIQAFREVGVPIEQATRNLAGFSDAMADLTLVNGRLRSELLTGGFLDLQRMQQTLAKADAAKSVQEQANIFRHAAHEVRDYWTAMAGPQEGARRERQFLQAIGAPDLARLRRELEGVAAWQQALFDNRKKAADEYLETSEKTSYAYERIGDSIGAIAIDIANATGAAKAWAEYMSGVAEAMERIHARLGTAGAEADKAAPRPEGFWERLDPFNRANAARERAVAPELRTYPGMTPENLQTPGGVPQMFTGGGATGGGGRFTPDPNFLSGSPESTNIEDRRALVEDQTDQMKELTDQLKELNANMAYGFLDTQMGGLAPGLGRGTGRGGGGGAGAGGGMGALPGMGPAPGGGGGQPNDSGTPSGTPGTNTGGTPGTAAAPAWPSPTAGNVMPPGFGGGGGPGIGGGAKLPWAGTVAPGSGGAWEGKPVATPQGWGPGGSGQPWGTQAGAGLGGGGGAQGGAAPAAAGAAPAAAGGAPGGSTRATWFHTGEPIVTPGGTWSDPSGRAEGAPASGLGHNVPGIATPGRGGLGDWFEVKTPDGRVAYVQKTDIGPGRGPQSRGVGADINAGLASQLYPKGPGSFQEQGWGIRRVGPKLPEGVSPGIQPATGTASSSGNQPAGTPVSSGNSGGDGSLVPTAPRSYTRRKGEPGEFNAARTGEFGAPGANLTKITLKNGQTASVNAAVADRYTGFLNEMIDRGYPVDLRGGGGYANRGKRGGGGPSMHAYGTAVDINVGRNPFQGNRTDMPEGVEETAWKHGLSWGGRFGDPMHFEAMGTAAWQSKQKQLAERGKATTPTAAGGTQTAAGGRSGAVANALDWSTGRELDKRQAVDVNGTGKLDVNVNAPNGTNVKAEGSGLFKKTEITRQTQMEPAQKGPTHSANADEE